MVIEKTRLARAFWHRLKMKSIKKGAILAIGNPECDHKDGRRDDPGRITLDDFQPLFKAANNAKKQHCEEFRKTDKRFDAKRLSYSTSQWVGNGRYMRTCVGCYWHDPFNFNQERSKNA